MADKTSQLVLDALSRAAVEPAGVPLFSQKAGPGLFTGAALAKQAAKHCKEQDFVRVVRTETRGKAAHEVVTITHKGMEHLLSHKDLSEVLSDVVRAVEGREKQLAELLASIQQTQASITALRELACKAMKRIEGKSDCAKDESAAAIVNALRLWRANSAAEDCPLPHLYKQVTGLTIGEFHDVVRQLYAARRLYLHPWTGPLSELPRPDLTMMVGHEIAYYASLRDE